MNNSNNNNDKSSSEMDLESILETAAALGIGYDNIETRANLVTTCVKVGFAEKIFLRKQLRFFSILILL